MGAVSAWEEPYTVLTFHGPTCWSSIRAVTLALVVRVRVHVARNSRMHGMHACISLASVFVCPPCKLLNSCC